MLLNRTRIPGVFQGPSKIQEIFQEDLISRSFPGTLFFANFAFSHSHNFSQILPWRAIFGKFVTLWSAIFRKVRKFCNLRTLCTVTSAKFTYQTRCALWNYPNITNYTKNSIVLWLPYCISGTKPRKSFRHNHKTFKHNFWEIFCRFSADFYRAMLW